MIFTRVAATVAAAALAMLGVSVAAAPSASAATVSITVDCNSDIVLNANPGDTVQITMSSDCLNDQGVICNTIDPFPFGTAGGFFSIPSSYGTSPRAGDGGCLVASGDWYAYSDGTGGTVIITTLLSTDGAGTPLQVGSTVATTGPTGSATPYRILYGGGVAASASKDLTIWQKATGRASANAGCDEGWSPSWQQWPNGGAGGWVCVKDTYAYYPEETVQ